MENIQAYKQGVFEDRTFVAGVVFAIDLAVLVSVWTVLVWLSFIAAVGGYEIRRLYLIKLGDEARKLKWQLVIAGSILLYGLMVFAYLALYLQPGGPLRCLQMIIAVRAFDVCALMGGQAFQKFAGQDYQVHRISSISPGKTWEGFAVGMTVALLTIAIPALFFRNLPLGLISIPLMFIALTIGHLVGDLGESKFKRWIGEKDSGTLLRGHGGILDRFDSMPAVTDTVLFYRLLHLL